MTKVLCFVLLEQCLLLWKFSTNVSYCYHSYHVVFSRHSRTMVKKNGMASAPNMVTTNQIDQLYS